jgi:hypothetical protein
LLSEARLQQRQKLPVFLHFPSFYGDIGDSFTGMVIPIDHKSLVIRMIGFVQKTGESVILVEKSATFMDAIRLS